jgi:hypothetical protein
MRITLLVLVAACSPTTRPTNDRVEPEPEPPVVEAQEPAPAPIEEESKPPASMFHAVAKVIPNERDDRAPHFRVFEAATGELFASVGPQVVEIGDEGSFARDIAWLEGIHAFDQETQALASAVASWDVIEAGGRWPDAFYITVSAELGLRGGHSPHHVYRRESDRWVEVASKGSWFHWFIADAVPWKDGSVLALRGFEPVYEYRGEDDEAEATKASVRRADAAVAKQKPLIVIRGAGKAPDLGRRDVASIDALDTGEIVGVVIGESPLVVHYDPASGRTTQRPLPEGNLREANVLLEGATRAWVYGRMETEASSAPYLARFDGEAWQREAVPGCKDVGLGSLSRSPEGDTWAVCGYGPAEPVFEPSMTGLWLRKADADAWEQVALPDDAMPVEVLARDRDDVWVAGAMLLHTKPRDRVAEVPGYAGLWLDINERRAPVPAFECDEGTIFIEGSPKEAHADLAAKLGEVFAGSGGVGSALVEVTFRGEPRLAFQHHTSPERAVEDRIREVLGKRMLDSYCLLRDPTREIASW